MSWASAAVARGQWTVLRVPAYRRLFAAQTISRWGDTFNSVALAIVVFRLTGSGLGVVGVVAAEIVPVLMLAPVAGLVVDQFPRRRLMIAADLWRALAAAALPLVIDSTGGVYTVAVALSAGSVLFNPAAQSVLPSVVEKDQLVAANSGLWSAAVTSQIALAPVAGLLVVALGPTPAFLLNAATFAISAAILARLRLPMVMAGAPISTPWRVRLIEGTQLFTRGRLLRTLALVQVMAALSAGATSALLVVLAERRLGAAADGYGLLLGAIGVGAAAGPLILARLTSNARQPGLVFGALLLRGGVDLALATVTQVWAAVAALVAYGLGTSTGTVAFNSLLQAELPEEQRGRVFAGFDALWQTGRLASLGLGGVLADALGIQAVYALGGLLLITAAAFGLATLRQPQVEHPP